MLFIGRIPYPDNHRTENEQVKNDCILHLLHKLSV